jgi:hypothetical protein
MLRIALGHHIFQIWAVTKRDTDGGSNLNRPYWPINAFVD